MTEFTLESTIVLGLVLIALVFFLYKFFTKLNIKIDKKFFYGILPWLILSVFVRVYEDAGIYPDTIFTKTPGIIIVFVAIVIPVFFFANWLEKKKGFPLWKTMAITGTILIIPHLPFIQAVNPKGAGLIFIFFAICVGIFGVIKKLISKHYKLDFLMSGAITAHLLDASATFVSLTFYGYNEQHVLPTFLINLAGGAWIMYPLKMAVIIPVVYLINRYAKEDKRLRNLLLIAVAVLGLAPGLRDMFRLFMGV
jgi:uncharacterized membrane protein